MFSAILLAVLLVILNVTVYFNLYKKKIKHYRLPFAIFVLSTFSFYACYISGLFPIFEYIGCSILSLLLYYQIRDHNKGD